MTTAPDQTIGEMLRTLLEENGVVAMIQPEDAVSFLGVSSIPCRLLVPIEQADVARELIAEFESAPPDWEDEEFDDESEDSDDDGQD